MYVTQTRAARIVSQAPERFDPIVDLRNPRAVRHSLGGLLNLLMMNFACGRLTLRQAEALSEDMQPGALRRMGLKRRVSDTCLYELASTLPDDCFREVLWNELREAIDRKAIRPRDLFPEGVLVFDGKGAGGGLGEAPNKECRVSVCDAAGTKCWDLYTLRAALVSSLARPVLDQEFIKGKGNESPAFRTVYSRLAERFPQLFSIVMFDAGMTGAQNASLILSTGKKFVMAVKGNRAALHESASAALANSPVLDKTQERANGQTVIRAVRRVAAPLDTKFPGATQFWSVTQLRLNDDGTTSLEEERLFVTSIPLDALSPALILRLVRLQWGIENGPNWTADVIFKEDTRVSCTPGITLLCWLRILAYNLVSIFRSHLPQKDNRPQTWQRACELIYQAHLLPIVVRRTKSLHAEA